MGIIDFTELLKCLNDKEVERPNRAESGTLSGHAAGEPFEKLVYQHLKKVYPSNIYKQYEFLNDLYRKHPKSISTSDRMNLFNSPTALFLLSRGDAATRDWNPSNVFEEKQNDTADILYCKDDFFDIIDIKTRNISKSAQAPNIISAYKVAQMCALMIDNQEFSTIGINYIEVDWLPEGGNLKCISAHYANLFKTNPADLYINWAAAMQIQFHVKDLNQDYKGTVEDWAKEYIRTFVASAERRCKIMYDKYVVPFQKYIE